MGQSVILTDDRLLCDTQEQFDSISELVHELDPYWFCPGPHVFPAVFPLSTDGEDPISSDNAPYEVEEDIKRILAASAAESYLDIRYEDDAELVRYIHVGQGKIIEKSVVLNAECLTAVDAFKSMASLLSGVQYGLDAICGQSHLGSIFASMITRISDMNATRPAELDYELAGVFLSSIAEGKPLVDVGRSLVFIPFTDASGGNSIAGLFTVQLGRDRMRSIANSGMLVGKWCLDNLQDEMDVVPKSRIAEIVTSLATPHNGSVTCQDTPSFVLEALAATETR